MLDVRNIWEKKIACKIDTYRSYSWIQTDVVLLAANIVSLRVLEIDLFLLLNYEYLFDRG